MDKSHEYQFDQDVIQQLRGELAAEREKSNGFFEALQAAAKILAEREATIAEMRNSVGRCGFDV